MSVKKTNDKAFPNQPGKAYYYMLHWNEKKTNFQKGHWLESCVVSLQEDSIERIDHFAMAMIEAIGCKMLYHLLSLQACCSTFDLLVP